MNKVIKAPLVLLLLFSASLLYSQNPEPVILDLYPTSSSLLLKGKVKSSHSKEFGLKNNSQMLSQESSDLEKVSFYPNGSIDENISYINGSLFKKAKYNRISPFYVEVENQHALGKGISYDALIFDSSGFIKEHYEDFSKEGSGFKNKSFYVKKCLMNQMIYKNISRPDSIISFENKKVFHSKSIYKYNNEGFPVEETLILNDPIGNKITVYEYNKEQRLVESKTTYTSQDNKQSEISKYFYNLKGNIETHTTAFYSDADFTNLDNSISLKYKYEYDSQGNWIKVTKYEDDKIQSVTVRTIIYY
jgi:hypothetical protein